MPKPIIRRRNRLPVGVAQFIARQHLDNRELLLFLALFNGNWMTPPELASMFPLGVSTRILPTVTLSFGNVAARIPLPGIVGDCETTCLVFRIDAERVDHHEPPTRPRLSVDVPVQRLHCHIAPIVCGNA